EHAHVIGSRPVEALGGGGHSAEDIPTADDDTELVALPLRGRDLAGKAGNGLRLDPELPLPHQCLAGDLEQDPVEARAGHAAEESPRCNKAAPPLWPSRSVANCLEAVVVLSDRLRVFFNARRRRDFRSEIVYLLVTATTELEAHEADELDASPGVLRCRGDDLGHRGLAVDDEQLRRQRIFLAE